MQQQIIDDIIKERERQDEKWGVQNHDPIIWLAILTEEVGELAQATLHHELLTTMGSYAKTRIRNEAIQVAAVAVALLESL
jgi:NTP pyrophosphatase (non-canonical NTP hydrolase)